MLHVFATIFFMAVLAAALTVLLLSFAESWHEARRALGLVEPVSQPRHTIRVRRMRRPSASAVSRLPLRAAA